MYSPRKLAWDESLSTGDQELDAQHRYLIDIFNDLGTAIEDGLSAEDIGKVLSILKYYAGWHFGKEEACMARFHCPAAAKNKTAHEAFIRKYDEYKVEFEASKGSMDLALRIHTDLSNWIVNHILAVDSQLYSCIHPGPTPANSG